MGRLAFFPLPLPLPLAPLALALALAAAGLTGCFTPQQPACAFSCARDQLCPTDYRCGADGFCHRDNATGECLLTPPADGSTADALAGEPGGDGAAP